MLDDLAWAYAEHLKTRVYAVIPAGTQRFLVANFRDGKTERVSLLQEQLDGVLAGRAERVRWAAIGYSEKADRSWNGNNRDRFLRAIDAERDRHGRAERSTR